MQLLEKVREIVQELSLGSHWREFQQECCGSGSAKWATEIEELEVPLKEAGIILSVEDGYGGEGKGDDYWGVFSISEGDRKEYYKISGYYASYSGSSVEYDDFTQVIPAEKTVIYWKKA